jgi:hypothetical protein
VTARAVDDARKNAGTAESPIPSSEPAARHEPTPNPPTEDKS